MEETYYYLIASNSFEQVGTSNSLTTHTLTNLPAHKNGYLYLYVSNETPNIDVFFDNLQVTHLRGLVLEETLFATGLVLPSSCGKNCSTSA